jgi:hypothetical protein
MCCVKYIAALALSLSIALAGFPAQATERCPMLSMLHQKAAGEAASAHDCGACPGRGKESGQKQSGCCGDTACQLQCFPAAGMSLLPPAADSQKEFLQQSQGVFRPAPAPASHWPDTQDRPPKNLS